MTPTNNTWEWQNLKVAWKKECSNNDNAPAVLLIHGFGACKEHWRHNQPVLGQVANCFAIDLIGFGQSSQPRARLNGDPQIKNDFTYNFDNWAQQISDFCQTVIQRPVLLIGNSIGGVIALRASQILDKQCSGIVLIGCATRALDDKRLADQPRTLQWIRPWIKTLVRQRWLSINLFRNAASAGVIKRVLKQAYPSGKNIDENLIRLLQKPSQRKGASEAFHGFINLFDDYLAPQLLTNIDVPVDLIWGEKDPWEPLEMAKSWSSTFPCIRSLEIIKGGGHCPHDEFPSAVNNRLLEIIQATK